MSYPHKSKGIQMIHIKILIIPIEILAMVDG